MAVQSLLQEMKTKDEELKRSSDSGNGSGNGSGNESQVQPPVSFQYWDPINHGINRQRALGLGLGRSRIDEEAPDGEDDEGNINTTSDSNTNNNTINNNNSNSNNNNYTNDDNNGAAYRGDDMSVTNNINSSSSNDNNDGNNDIADGANQMQEDVATFLTLSTILRDLQEMDLSTATARTTSGRRLRTGSNGSIGAMFGYGNSHSNGDSPVLSNHNQHHNTNPSNNRIGNNDHYSLSNRFMMRDGSRSRAESNMSTTAVTSGGGGGRSSDELVEDNPADSSRSGRGFNFFRWGST